MRNFIPTAATRSRSMMVAVVLGTAVAAGDAKAIAPAHRATMADSGADVVQDLSRYCQACWRNARLPADAWPDCTQQVFARLLERVEPAKWSTLIQTEGEERKEFFRAIDAVKKRTQRARRFVDLSTDVADRRAADAFGDRRDELARASQEVLSPRQRRIVELTAGGWGVPEIANELGTTPERISDEKYKAIRKLRTHLQVDETAA